MAVHFDVQHMRLLPSNLLVAEYQLTAAVKKGRRGVQILLLTSTALLPNTVKHGLLINIFKRR